MRKIKKKIKIENISKIIALDYACYMHQQNSLKLFDHNSTHRVQFLSQQIIILRQYSKFVLT